MKILQLINAPANSYVLYQDENGDTWREPIVCLGIVDEDGLIYVDAFAGGKDGTIESIDELSCYADFKEVIWNEQL